MRSTPSILALFLTAACALAQLGCQQAAPVSPKPEFSLMQRLMQEGKQQKSAPPTTQDKLFQAIDEGNLADVRKLIAEGADVNTPNCIRHTPLDDAVARGNREIVLELLAAGADTNNGAPLLSAVGYNQRDMVKLLLERGAKVDQQEEDGILGTPLIFAAIEGNADIARDLLAAEANVNSRNSNGATALMEAVEEKHTALVPLLLQAGADVNAADNFGVTALWHAASQGNLATAKLLIDAGADVNARSSNQGSILETAALDAKSVEMVRLLLKHGASRKMDDSRVFGYLNPDCSFEVPSDRMLDALEAAGYKHGISREKTQQQRLDEILDSLQPLPSPPAEP